MAVLRDDLLNKPGQKTSFLTCIYNNLSQYQGMIKKQVNSHIMPLWIAGGEVYVDLCIQPIQ